MTGRPRHLLRLYGNWWTGDYPPLHGSLRFFFYAALFVLAVRNLKSPLMGIGFYEETDARLFQAYGLLELLKITYIEPDVVRVVVVGTAVAWVMAAIGLFSRVAIVVTALGTFLLHGLFFASNSLNHYWFLTVYAMFALCFARTNDSWSVDYWLSKTENRRSSHSLLDTGFARKMVLVFAVGFYFAAGASKLTTSGFAWADGHVIHYFAQVRGDGYLLGPLLASNLALCQVLAAGSLALEVGAPLALFSRRLRVIF